MSIDRLIAAHLRLANEALEAADLLAKVDNRNAAYEAAQALEQIILALAQSENIPFNRSHHHQLDTIIGLFPDENGLKGELGKLSWLEMFATAFRYPKTSGSLRDRPPPDRLRTAIDRIGRLIQQAAEWFGVDLQLASKTAAERTNPYRS